MPSQPYYFTVRKLTTACQSLRAIALYLRRPTHSRPYLYTQIFCGLCYICASLCLWAVRVLWERRVESGAVLAMATVD